jgi:hypothetical protein
MCFFKIQEVLFQGAGCAIPIYRMYYSKIQDVLFQDLSSSGPNNSVSLMSRLSYSGLHTQLLCRPSLSYSVLITQLFYGADLVILLSELKYSRICYSQIQDVLFLDTGCGFPKYRKCYSKGLDVLLQYTGCAIPSYRMCYSKISVPNQRMAHGPFANQFRSDRSELLLGKIGPVRRSLSRGITE